MSAGPPYEKLHSSANNDLMHEYFLIVGKVRFPKELNYFSFPLTLPTDGTSLEMTT